MTGGGAAAAACATGDFGQLFRGELFLGVAHNDIFLGLLVFVFTDLNVVLVSTLVGFSTWPAKCPMDACLAL